MHAVIRDVNPGCVLLIFKYKVQVKKKKTKKIFKKPLKY